MSAGLLTNKVTIIKMINRKNEPQRKLRDYYICVYLHDSNKGFRSKIRAYV